MKILFIPQNNNHLLNYIVICEKLRLEGVQADFYLLNIDDFLKQNIELDRATDFNIIDVKSVVSKPFYLCGYYTRIRLIGRFLKEIKCLGLPDFDVVFHGGESAFLYGLLSVIYKPRVVIGVLDGFLFPDKTISIYKYYLLEKVRKILRFTNFGYVVPSVIGGEVTAAFFVMSKGVGDILRSRGFKGSLVVSKLPRHDKESKSVHQKGNVNILYAATAFGWHGRSDLAIEEKSQIMALLDYSQGSSRLTLKVRLHPRGDANTFDSSTRKHFSCSESLSSDLKWADVVLSAGSSISLEAALCGKKVGVWRGSLYGINSEYPVVRDLNLPLLESFEDLDSLIQRDKHHQIMIDDFDIRDVLRWL